MNNHKQQSFSHSRKYHDNSERFVLNNQLKIAENSKKNTFVFKKEKNYAPKTEPTDVAKLVLLFRLHKLQRL